MDRDTALDEVRNALDSVLGVPLDKIVPKARLRADLELDSLDLAELVAVLEGRSGRTIAPELVENVRTVDDVVKVLVRLAADGAERPRDSAAGS